MDENLKRKQSSSSIDDSQNTLRSRDNFAQASSSTTHAHGHNTGLSATSEELCVGATLCGGRFSIVRRLGEGGMGVVYEALDLERRERLACKTMKRRNARGVYQLKNEFRALCDMQHPNLVRLYELFAEDDAWFLTMELIEGVPFDRYARPRGTLDKLRLLDTTFQLFEAVHAIHASDKLHRDLKPSNVLVTTAGRVVVLDFGLVSQPEGGYALHEENYLGTPPYMAPEQAGGKRATRASDYYALGVMLFEALTGELPFDQPTEELFVAKRLSDAPRASSRAEVPAGLDQLCAELLSRDPQQRIEALLDLRSRVQLARLFEPLPRSSLRYETPRALEITPLLATHAERFSTPLPRALAQADTRTQRQLLGRERELAALRDAYNTAQRGRPVVVFVSGESGFGKSALVSHFTSELRDSARATVLTGRCHEREHVPYQGFDTLMDDLGHYLRQLSYRDAAALMPREIFALGRMFPTLQRVRAVAEAQGRSIPDLRDLRQHALDAFAKLLACMRERAPVVLVIDDAQWLDRDGAQLMRALLVRPDPVAYCLVCVHRSENAHEQRPLGSVQNAARDTPGLDVRTLSVGPLPQAALVKLLRLRATSAIDDATAELLASESLGSPFFAAALSRVASQRSRGLPPPSLDDVLSLHIGALPTQARNLLTTVALAGTALPPSLLFDAARVNDGHAYLDLLRSEQLVRLVVDQSGQRLLECYHDRIREHVTSRLSAVHTRELWLSLARALAMRVGTPHEADVHPELIAHALDAAGLPNEAAEHTLRAAKRALSALAFDRAARLYARALATGGFDHERRHELTVARAKALAFAGQGALAGEAFLEAAQGPLRADTQELVRSAAEQFLLCGDLARGRAQLARTLAEGGIRFQHTDRRALMSTTWSLTRLLLRGHAYAARNKQRDPALKRKVELLGLATYSLMRSDQLRAFDYCARWARAALDAGDERHIARALAIELIFEIWMPVNTRTRLKHLEQACQTACERSGDWLARAWFEFALGWRHMVTGDPTAGLAKLERSLALIDDNPTSTSSYDRAWFQSFRAMGLLLAGRIAEAGELAQIELERALARDDHSVTVNLVLVATWTWIAADRPDYAAQQLAAAYARLRTDEPNTGYFSWLYVSSLPQIYRGHAYQAWLETAPHVEHFRSSFMGRVSLRGVLERDTCGQIVAAAQQADDPAEQRRLARLAKQHAATAQLRMGPGGLGIPHAAMACLRGDRKAAIAILRKQVALHESPLHAHVAQRRLGELLNNAEGIQLMREADAFLCAGGVVHPARFVATALPGVELRVTR